MFYWQPGKWVQNSVWVIAPFLGASLVTTPGLKSDVSANAMKAAGPWAQVALDGRDATITGTAPNDAAKAAAVKAVESGAYGVRLVNTDGIKVAPPPPPPPPKVEPLAAPTVGAAKAAADGSAVINGTWPEGKAKTLDVTVNTNKYSLGKSPELSSKDGNWTLKLGAGALAAGAYAVSAAVGDGDKQMVSGAAPAKLEVAAAPPPPPPPPPPPKVEPLAAPTVAAAKAEANGSAVISGTWPEGKAKTLDVTVNDIRYSLGKSPELTSKDGTWSLKLGTGALMAGAYAVTAAVGDGDKQSVAAAAPGKVEVAEAPTAKVEPMAAPTISSAKGDDRGTEIKGTWAEGRANLLDVALDNKVYSLGDSKELTSAKGVWTLALPALAVGSHSVSVTESGNGEAATAATPLRFDVAAPAPPPPPPKPPAAATVENIVSDVGAPKVTGTWPVGNGNRYEVSLGGVSHVLGKDTDLLSGTNGKWTLVPAKPLANGVYDVAMKVTGADGQVTNSLGKGAVTVNVPPPPPEPLTPPTITAAKGDDKGTTVIGTWAEGKATVLEVGVDRKIYSLGQSPELTTSKGIWTLTLPALPPGNHAVGAFESDGKQNLATAQPTPLVVAAAAPPPPPPAPKAPAAATVENVVSDVDHPKVTGTWPVGNGNRYQVELDGVTHTLGKDTDLLTSTGGKWTLVPAKPLVNGIYDVVMKVTGADGQVTNSVGKGAVTVKVPPPAPPPPKEAPYDCVAELGKAAAAFPIRFEYDHADLGPDFVLAVNNYSKLMMDPRCAKVRMQVIGHADFKGSVGYNQSLSERRAGTVVDLLAKAGISKDRLMASGAGKLIPLDPANSDDARAKNRRVEFNAQQ